MFDSRAGGGGILSNILKHSFKSNPLSFQDMHKLYVQPLSKFIEENINLLKQDLILQQSCQHST